MKEVLRPKLTHVRDAGRRAIGWLDLFTESSRATSRQRAALTAVEEALAGDELFTAREVAAATGLDHELLRATRRALGLAEPEPDDPAFGHRDVEAAQILAEHLASGVPEDVVLEASRVLGRGLAQCAQASVGLLDRAEPNGGGAAAVIMPDAALLHYMFLLHAREELRDRVASAAVIDGRDPRVRQIFVGFVDMVGFTQLAQQREMDEIGALVSRFADMANASTAPPARLVKGLGDAAMFVSTEPPPLTETVLGLIALASESDGFPVLRAGIAAGMALNHEGDWYGPPVNLASRLTAVAPPGAVLASDEVRDANPEEPWAAAGAYALKGFTDPVEVHELRPSG